MALEEIWEEEEEQQTLWIQKWNGNLDCKHYWVNWLAWRSRHWCSRTAGEGSVE